MRSNKGMSRSDKGGLVPIGAFECLTLIAQLT